MSTTNIVFIRCPMCKKLIVINESEIKVNYNNKSLFYSCPTIVYYRNSREALYPYKRREPLYCDTYLDCNNLEDMVPSGISIIVQL